MECTYCHNLYSNKYTLRTHQTTSKKCIEIQEEITSTIIQKRFVCKFCDKQLTSNERLQKHMDICKRRPSEEELKIKEELRIKMERIKELEDKIYKHETETKNIHNTTNNTTNNINMSNSNNTHNTNISIINYMTEERVLQIFKDHFQLKDLEQSRLGMFTVKHMLTGKDKPVYKCTDLSRKRCVYIDASGNETVDKNMKVLIDLLHQANPYVKELIQDDIIDQEEDVITTLRSEYKDYINLETDGSEFKSIVAKCTSNVPVRNKLNIDDIDWDINMKRAKLKEIEEEKYTQVSNKDEDVFGFFS